MHRDERYGPCRSLSPPIVKQNDYRGWEGRCQVWVENSADKSVVRNSWNQKGHSGSSGFFSYDTGTRKLSWIIFAKASMW